MPKPWRASRAELLGLLLGLGLLVWGGLELRAQLVGPEPEESCCRIGGAGFGMTAEQLRERFDPGAKGTWTLTTQGKDQLLEWKRAEDRPRAPREVRFELHQGILTGVRAKLDPQSEWAEGPARVETPLLVTVRRPAADGSVDYVSLARDCVQQADEVARLLGTAPASPSPTSASPAASAGEPSAPGSPLRP